MVKRVPIIILAIVLAVGLVPLPAAAEDAVDASGQTQQLEAGAYVEHEAIAYVIDGEDDGITPFSLGGDALSGAQDLMDVDGAAAEEALGEDAADQVAAPAARARTLTDSGASGRLVLVHDDSKTTEQLVADLQADPRVVFAEPNAIVEEEDSENDELRQEMGEILDQGFIEGSGQTDDEEAAGGETAFDSEGSEVKAASENAEDASGFGAPANDALPTTDEGEGGAATAELAADGTAQGPDTQASAHFGTDSRAAAPDLNDWVWGFSNDGSLGGVLREDAIDMRSSAWVAQDEGDLEPVLVAVIDSGVDASHPDLAPVMWNGGLTSGIKQKGGEDAHGFSVEPDADSTSNIVNYHGTHVAGTIGAEWNETGVSGIAPNVQIMSVRHDDTLEGLLRCLDYVSRARDAGVNVRITSNSWGLGQVASRAVDLAVTELGQKGVASIFGSGNAASDLDVTSSTLTTLADNPYAVGVDSLDPDGSLSLFSQYGETSTDVMAPGAVILSTDSQTKQSYLGEADDGAVFYESFDDESGGTANGHQKMTFSLMDGSQGQVVTGKRAFDGDGSYELPYAGTQQTAPYCSSPIDLSSVAEKPRYLSLRYLFDAGDTGATGQINVAVRLADGSWAQLLPQGTFGEGESWGGCCFDLSTGYTVVDGQLAPLAISAAMIDWKNFQLQLIGAVVDFSMVGGVGVTSGAPVPATIVLDSIGLGNDLVPYAYRQGTSMACPAVSGAAAVIAGTGDADVAGSSPESQAKSAEKLAALVRAYAQPVARYDGLCSTGGFATVDGTGALGPAITQTIDDGSQLKVRGYFLSETATVKLDGMDARVTGATDLGDGESELVVAKPDSFAGGEVTVRVDLNGKHSCQRANLGQAAQASYYDQTNLPVPDELESWGGWQLVGYAGSVFCVPRTLLFDVTTTYDHILRYDPAVKTWERVALPTADELKAAGLGAVIDVTAVAFNGDLAVLLGDSSGRSALFSYSQQRVLDKENPWSSMGFGYTLSFNEPFTSTLASDGSALYLFGGFIGDMGDNQSAVPYIYRIDLAQKSLAVVGRLSLARMHPNVAFRDGAFAVAGGVVPGSQMGGVSGADLVRWADTGQGTSMLMGTAIDFSSLIGQDTGQLVMGAGATERGFVFVGPQSSTRAGDTYTLTLRDGALAQFGQRASQQTLLTPAALAYDGMLYVLATAETEPRYLFSATSVSTVAQPGDFVPKEDSSTEEEGGKGETGEEATGETDGPPAGDPQEDSESGQINPLPADEVDADQSLKDLAATGDSAAALVLGAVATAALAAAAVAGAARRKERR